jgi:hypothetical protein
MPRIVRKKKVKRIEVEDVCEAVLCDFCGRMTDDHGTGPGVIDWGERIGEACTVCWAMWEEGKGPDDEETHEIVICPGCFLKLERLLPEIRKLMGV